MADESETHKEVCDEMRSFGNMPPPMFAWRDLAERAEAAHKREIDAISAERDEWQKQALEENAALDVARSELAANDAEIARLKDKISWLSFRVDNRNSLIKELADALNSYLAGECIDCGAKCEGDGACVHQKNLRALVKKAREVVNG